MIDGSILAAIEARLRGALALPPIRYRPLLVGGSVAGLVDSARATRLAAFAAFRHAGEALELDPRLATCAARTGALAEVALALRAEGALPAWRDERYAVAPELGAPPWCFVERGAARYLGVRTWAAHVNGIDRHGGPTRMWLARRSEAKAVDPGLLDNLVGGGIGAGFGVEETLVKESWEEAGITADLARSARPAGVVHARRAMFDGLQRETLYVYDLELPHRFVPRNQDGEVDEHRLVDLAEAARTIAHSQGPDVVTVEASMVVLDYLMRAGAFARDAARSAALEALLRASP